ncbi:MAG: hypothetical protein V1668_00730 [Patescibacteria group bacterium]
MITFMGIDNLVRQFRELKDMEDDSARLYASILPDVADPQDRETLRRIITDEERHSRMVQEIIDLIKS